MAFKASQLTTAGVVTCHLISAALSCSVKSAGKNLRAPPRCDADKSNIGSWLGSSPPQILFRSFEQGLPFKGQISGRSTQNKKKWPIKEVLSGRIHVSWRSASNLNWFTRTTVKGQFYRQGPPSSRLATTQKAVKNACPPFFLTTSPLNGFCYSGFHAPTCSLSPSEKKIKKGATLRDCSVIDTQSYFLDKARV